MNAYAYSLLAALVWGIAPLFEKYALVRVDPMAGLLVRSAGVFMGALAVWSLLPEKAQLFGSLTPASIVCFATAGILASVIGQVFAYNAIRLADVSQVTPIMGAWPLLAMFLGFLIFKEPITLKKLLGSGFIIFGVWLLRF